MSFYMVMPVVAVAVAAVAVYMAVRHRRGEDRLGPADPGVGATRRVYFYAVSFASLMMAGNGIVLMLHYAIEAVFGGAVIYSSQTDLAVGMSLTLVGLPLWAFHWRVVQRQSDGAAVERRSLVRKVYLYAVLGVSVGMVIASSIELVELALRLRELRGWPWGGLAVWGAAWAFHWAAGAAGGAADGGSPGSPPPLRLPGVAGFPDHRGLRPRDHRPRRAVGGIRRPLEGDAAAAAGERHLAGVQPRGGVRAGGVRGVGAPLALHRPGRPAVGGARGVHLPLRYPGRGPDLCGGGRSGPLRRAELEHGGGHRAGGRALSAPAGGAVGPGHRSGRLGIPLVGGASRGPRRRSVVGPEDLRLPGGSGGGLAPWPSAPGGSWTRR